MTARSADGEQPRPAPARASTAAQVSLQLKVARRFYVEDISKVEIAKEFGISRFQVARLLQSARDSGVVRITVEMGPGDHPELASQLADQLGLLRCAVLGGAEGDGSVGGRRVRLGELAAQELSNALTPGDVLGLPWSRSVSATVAALRSLPPVAVVQLSGARYEVGADQSSAPADMVRDVAAIAGGRGYRFHAPFIAPDEAAAAYLRRDPAYAAAHQHVSSVTVSAVSVGAFGPGLSTLYEAATPEEIDELVAGGAVGEVSGVFIDDAGRHVPNRFERRLLTTTAEELRAIPQVIGICMGADRARAIAAACRGGFVDSLVVDVPLAHELLRDDYRASRG